MAERHELVLVDEEFDGPYELVFLNDQVAIVKIVRVKRNANGSPIYLYDDTGRIYNFNTIISLKPQEKPHG